MENYKNGNRSANPFTSVIITYHSFMRGKERCGYNAQQLENHASRAWRNGKSVTDYTGEARKILMEKENRYPNSLLRMHGDVVYIFTPAGALKTLYPADKHFLEANQKKCKRPKGKKALGHDFFCDFFINLLTNAKNHINNIMRNKLRR